MLNILQIVIMIIQIDLDTSHIISHHLTSSRFKSLKVTSVWFFQCVRLLGPLLFQGTEVAFVEVHEAVAQLPQQAPCLAELRVLHGHDPNPQPNRRRRRRAVDAKEGQEKRGLKLSAVRRCQTVT